MPKLPKKETGTMPEVQGDWNRPRPKRKSNVQHNKDVIKQLEKTGQVKPGNPCGPKKGK